jgi:hypothetical protein
MRLLLAIAVLAWSFAGGMLYGQNTATLIGTATDESNAVHPGTLVTATENSTGQQYSATSDARGDYRIVDMQPGTYRVQATQAGFATLVLNNVQLLVGQTVTLPLALRLPSVSQTVEVQSDAELITRKPRMWAETSTGFRWTKSRYSAETYKTCLY